MRFLGLPADSSLDLYVACSKGVGSKETKTRFHNYKNQVINANCIYKSKCENNELHKLIDLYVNRNKLYTVPYVSNKEFNLLYKNQTGPNRPGRYIYNRLMFTPGRKCPFCSVGRVKNLDHFIPKVHFPIFSVTTLNLVPSCRDCNMDKKASFSADIRKQTLHPYFDDASDVQWLFAKVVDQSLPPVIDYFIDTSSMTSSTLASKVNAHFKEYDLANIFMDSASERVIEILDNCKNHFKEGGANKLKSFLTEGKESAEKVHKNSWSVAMYGALVDSVWFCERAFLKPKIEEIKKQCGTCKGKSVLDCQSCKPYEYKECKVCFGTFTIPSSNCPECKGYGVTS